MLFITGKESNRYKRKHPNNTRVISHPEKFAEEIKILDKKKE